MTIVGINKVHTVALRFVEKATGIKRSPDIFNLSKEFRDNLSELHKKGQCLCKGSGRYLGIEPDALVDTMPWMQENEIPSCIWALGGVIHALSEVNSDSLGVEKGLLEMANDAVF